jgi:phosphate transport system substrate-binding protein
VKRFRTGRAAGVAVLAVSAAVGLAACGSSSGTSATPSSSTSSGASGVTCAKGTLDAAGSTAQANAITALADAYEKACGSGVTINYNADGSGDGVTAFEQGTVAFAGSDYGLGTADVPAANKRCGSGNVAVNIPLVPGPIAIGYNLTGVTSLKLSAQVLAKIFSGKITKWNDRAITAINPGVSLPSEKIQPIHRSDSSGTTYNFTNYLNHLDPADWSYAANKDFPPAAGGVGAKGSSSVAAGVKQTQGAIGYFEDSYAVSDGIPVASIGNAAGDYIVPSITGAASFIAKGAAASDGKISFDYKDTSSSDYPNVLVTYEIVCGKGNSASTLPLLKDFLTYMAGAGQKVLPANGYASLPATVASKDLTTIAGLAS